MIHFSLLFSVVLVYVLLTQCKSKEKERRINSLGRGEDLEDIQNLNLNEEVDSRLLQRDELNLRNEMYEIKKVHGRETPEYVAGLHSLGRNIYKQGRFDEVMELAQEIVSIHEEMDGPEHINTAKALTNVGSTAHKLGMLRTCETAMNRALFIFIKVYGADAKEVRCCWILVFHFIYRL
jgi:hypothetical protein